MIFSFLYIDPGTGSMLFSLFVGLAATMVFVFRALFIKIRFVLSGGKTDKLSSSKIPYVIFSDHKRYWNVFKPICDEFEKRKINLVYYTQSADDPCFNEEYEYIKREFIGVGNKGFMKMNMLNAGIVISTTPGLGVFQWKRSKNVDKYVHIPHTVDDLGDYKMFGITNYDALFATGINQIDFNKKLELKRPGTKQKEYCIVGATFMDQALSHLQELPIHQINKNTPTILLAPSWGEKSILNIFGRPLLNALRNTGYKIIIRPHPQSYTAEKELIDSLMHDYSDFEWNKDNDNLSVLNKSDILITDFSGIIFDWALLFNKPLIFADAKMNKDSFDACWIEDELWRFSAAEKMGFKLCKDNISNIKDLIVNSFDDLTKINIRKDIKKECWMNIGFSTERIVNKLLEYNKE